MPIVIDDRQFRDEQVPYASHYLLFRIGKRCLSDPVYGNRREVCLIREVPARLPAAYHYLLRHLLIGHFLIHRVELIEIDPADARDSPPAEDYIVTDEPRRKDC